MLGLAGLGLFAGTVPSGFSRSIFPAREVRFWARAGKAFSPTTTSWLTPNSVLQPRFVKFSAQIDF